MNMNTPLPEVAAFLPQEAADLIVFAPVPRQTLILMRVRKVLVEWEERGVVLDPFSLGVVLTSLVGEIVAVLNAAIAHIQDPGNLDLIFQEPR